MDAFALHFNFHCTAKVVVVFDSLFGHVGNLL